MRRARLTHLTMLSARVERLGERVAALLRLGPRLRLHHALPPRRDQPAAEALLQGVRLHLQQRAHRLKVPVVAEGGVAVLVLLDREVAEVQDGRDGGEDVPLAFVVEADELERDLRLAKRLGVVRVLGHEARLGVGKLPRVRHLQVLQHLLRRRRPAHLVKDVVVALVGRLLHDAGLLEEVRLDLRARDGGLAVEVDVDPLAEARRVVVAHRLGVAEGLQHGVGHHDLLLDGGGARGGLALARGGEDLQDVLGALRLAGARLARDEDALVLARAHELAQRLAGHGEDVRLLGPAGLVQLHVLGVVYVDGFPRVDGDEDGARVRVHLPLPISNSKRV